ncbi:DNA cytosine methyltransferase [Rheinheimera mesophila]|uniref:DNA (cytosine-5-)-methyltransferase n=1 Tax=Rheinheimera mesophila TaxID=1547515 RepID=A0A3P3QMT3_9GAMM|nr:DNA cytosine methyltransferase [Rheinheimera mesophila]KKL00280.1 DNA methyltransferase [Rheinheimera mesophila]RRJ22547.1 DNA cytosine methyltransferase [Rheinheimera mesophila]
MRGLIVDNFAGGGGASTGIEMAIGRSVDIAINHDPDAIAMHTANHPNTLHYCESVFDVDPVQATAGRPVDLAWFSPDCTHFSKAKGSKPVSKEIRGLGWIAVRWILKTKLKVLFLENVEEYQDWGPVIEDAEGKCFPCPDRKGETFKAFVAILTTGINADHPALKECCEMLGINDPSPLIKGLGYKVEWRELRACDYGAPTIRKRLFLVARCDGRPIVWPTPTHGKPDSKEVKAGLLKPYRTAAECIDFSLPCRSIFGRKRPLAEATMKRIAKGLVRYVIEAQEPFIVTCNHSGDYFRGQGLTEPFKTIVASRDAHGLVVPELVPFITEHANASSQRNMPADEPLRTQCAQVKGGHFALVAPALAPFIVTNTTGHAPTSVNGQLPTQTTGNHHYLCAPVIARQFGKSIGHGVNEPSGTITAGGGGKSQLVAAFLAKHYGGNYTGPGASLQVPTPTVTTVDHNALVTSHLVKLRGTCKDGQPVTEPMPTITAGGNHVGEVRAFLLKYYGNEVDGADIVGPIGTITTRDRFGLVTVNGIDHVIVDIGMRMLQPHELFKAQGFPDDYIIDRDSSGKPMTKTAQVARCGNSVPPAFAEALTRANLPELCTSKQEQAA